MNTAELLRKAESGEILPEEVAEVARALRDESGGGDPYDLLLIVGKSGRREHSALVEAYLDQSDDPMLVRLAIQILCSFWGDGDRHMSRVREFVRGAKWDTENDVRLVAISIAGEYLRDHEDAPLHADLLRIFESEQEPSVVRDAAYSALARAAGKAWSSTPSAARLGASGRDIDPTVIASAKRRASV